jgi:hypothetical protein
MARYVATADVTVDGLTFERGSVLNIPTSVLALNSEANLSTAIPRVRPAGLEFDPLNYQAVALADQLGLQQATSTFPATPNNVIAEPVLPAANTQYD